eukprot:6947612-Prymnesium_polylepis.1
MQRLLVHFGDRLPGIDQFALLPPPVTPIGELTANRPPLRVQWVLPNFVVRRRRPGDRREI